MGAVRSFIRSCTLPYTGNYSFVVASARALLCGWSQVLALSAVIFTKLAAESILLSLGCTEHTASRANFLNAMISELATGVHRMQSTMVFTGLCCLPLVGGFCFVKLHMTMYLHPKEEATR